METSIIELPDIVIPSDKIEQFSLDLDLLGKMANQFGIDFSHLFGEICLLYDIKDEDALKDEQKRMTRGYALMVLGNLNFALGEVDILKNLVAENKDDSITITRPQYFQIFIMLRNLKTYYTEMLQLINEKSYFGEAFIATIVERLSFLYNVQFEELKSRFQVVESLRAAAEKKEPGLETIQ